MRGSPDRPARTGRTRPARTGSVRRQRVPHVVRHAPRASGVALPHEEVLAAEGRPGLAVLRRRALVVAPVVGEVAPDVELDRRRSVVGEDRKSTRLNSSHVKISYAVFCLKKKKKKKMQQQQTTSTHIQAARPPA